MAVALAMPDFKLALRAVLGVRAVVAVRLAVLVALVARALLVKGLTEAMAMSAVQVVAVVAHQVRGQVPLTLP